MPKESRPENFPENYHSSLHKPQKLDRDKTGIDDIRFILETSTPRIDLNKVLRDLLLGIEIKSGAASGSHVDEAKSAFTTRKQSTKLYSRVLENHGRKSCRANCENCRRS